MVLAADLRSLKGGWQERAAEAARAGGPVQRAQRDETVTPLSALALLNNKFMVRMAEHFAARLEAESSDRGQQMDMAFQLALSREPTQEERSAFVQYANDHGLPSACRVIINLNEFVFVD